MMQGTKYIADVVDEREKRLREAGGATTKANGIYVLQSPMPGLVVSIPVSVGDAIAEGDVLIILESMKMQNELKSPQGGIISEIEVQPGDSVEQKQRMLTITPPHPEGQKANGE
jgi:biotin carboxyl carrier protein